AASGPAGTAAMTAPPDAPAQEQVPHYLRHQPEPLFAILDAARDPRILALLVNSKEERPSLYEGAQGDRLAAVAAYLVQLPSASRFLDTLVQEGWGKSWGIYLTCNQPFKEVRKHFRRFLLVKTEEGKELYFRFYDPRVLR